MTPTDLANLFRLEAPRLMRRLRAFRGRVIAEDVLQSAFLRMLEADTSGIEDPKAYLAQLTRNLAIDELRRQNLAPVSRIAADAFGANVAAELTPEQIIIERERLAHITAAVLALPAHERSALLLFKLKG